MKSKIKYIIIIVITMLLFPQLSHAQADCACCTEDHSKFDFWVGDWIVYDTIGNKVGENQILKLEDNCLINENWKGETGGSGKSYNYFDSTDSTWNQVWIDNQGSNLVLKGRAEGNKMILQSRLVQGMKIDWYSNRITWTKNEDNSVTQLWEILDKNDKLLSVAFIGIYKKR